MSEVIQTVNADGFMQFEWDDQPGQAVCCECHAYIYPNRGAGCVCSHCESRLNETAD